MKVRTMLTNNGNPSKNQYIIVINDNQKAFQSYDTIIAVYDYPSNTIFENETAWMSKTTNQYYTKWRAYNIPLNQNTKFLKVSQNDINKIMEA
jgi:hypothetical protein